MTVVATTRTNAVSRFLNMGNSELPTSQSTTNYTHCGRAATKDLNRTALSNLIVFAGLFRKEQRREVFYPRHAQKINGVLECFDRVFLLGHLPMVGTGYFSTWLYSKRISLNLKASWHAVPVIRHRRTSRAGWPPVSR